MSNHVGDRLSVLLMLNFNSWLYDRLHDFGFLLSWNINDVFNRVVEHLLLSFIVRYALLMRRQLIVIIVTFNDFLFLFNGSHFLNYFLGLYILHDFSLDSVFESTLLSLSSSSLHNLLVFFGK